MSRLSPNPVPNPNRYNEILRARATEGGGDCAECAILKTEIRDLKTSHEAEMEATFNEMSDLKGTVRAQNKEIEELKKKLAAVPEAAPAPTGDRVKSES